MEQTAVQIMSKTKQRRSLGETKKREKSGRKSSRTAVVVPGDVEWPDVDEATSQELLDAIGRTMKCLNIPKRKCPLNEIKSVPKSERSEFRRKWIAEHSLQAGYDVSSYILKRSEIAIGVNCCSMNMEGNHLAGMIIEKNVDPQIITKLLVPIAISKYVPAISLSGLSTAFDKACGIKCIALGFKKVCESPSSEFYSILKLVKENAPLDVNLVLQRAAAMRLCLFPDSMQLVQQKSDSLVSSVGDSISITEPASKPSTSKPVPVGFSIQEEIDKLDLKKSQQKAKRGQAVVDSCFKPPKIRKMTPP